MSRSSRVDKGVSAMSLYMTMKLPKDIESCIIKEKMIASLPEDIVLYGKLVFVTNLPM